MAKKLLPLIPPGEFLVEDFMKPLGLSQNALARAIDVPPARINDIVHARRAITVETAARLAVFFGTSVDFWVNLQAHYDAKRAERELLPELRRQIKPVKAA